MAKKYVVENAELNCQYGGESWLVVPGDRHIEVSGKRMANETDYKKTCLGCGSFGKCHSHHISAGVSQLFHDALLEHKASNVHQLANAETNDPCQYQPGPQWMESKEDVYIGGYRALMEDSWIFCRYGLGFITLLNSGQSENPAEALAERLKQLEAVVDAYMKENGLSKKYKHDLINSVLLWNGYSHLPWDTKVSQELWDFGIYMEKNHPSLSNYFERGIYLFDEQTGSQIDVSYMAGLSVALNHPRKSFSSVLAGEAFEDEGAYNGYLEACRQKPAENALEAMEGFLDYYGSSEYNGSGRYSDYLEMSEKDRAWYDYMYEQGCSPMYDSYYETGIPMGACEDPQALMEEMEKTSRWNQWSQEEKDLLILERMLSAHVGQEHAAAFVKKVCESAGKERMSWKQ